MKKCARCYKPATLHITEIRDGQVHELHLCETCAQQYLSASQVPGPEEEFDEFSYEENVQFDELDQLACPSCGITFREFRKVGRLGCPHDYEVFKDELLPLIENIHGSSQHVGKIPKRAPQASQQHFRLIRLRNQLRAAVDKENYEEAAKLRDQIQELEAQLKESRPSESELTE